MALNPPVTMNGLPIRVADEFILLERDGIEIEVKVQGMSKLSAKGKVCPTHKDLLDLSQTRIREPEAVCSRAFQVLRLASSSHETPGLQAANLRIKLPRDDNHASVRAYSCARLCEDLVHQGWLR